MVFFLCVWWWWIHVFCTCGHPSTYVFVNFEPSTNNHSKTVKTIILHRNKPQFCNNSDIFWTRKEKRNMWYTFWVASWNEYPSHWNEHFVWFACSIMGSSKKRFVSGFCVDRNGWVAMGQRFNVEKNCVGDEMAEWPRGFVREKAARQKWPNIMSLL